MELIIQRQEDELIAELMSDEIIINEVQDAVDLLGNADYQGASKVIVPSKNFHPDFFDLRSGLAGEILQKFSTYRMRLAIVGDFSGYRSKVLKDFIFESNKLGQVQFVSSIEEARTK
jgi:hypothetical protein